MEETGEEYLRLLEASNDPKDQEAAKNIRKAMKTKVAESPFDKVLSQPTVVETTPNKPAKPVRHDSQLSNEG